MNDNANYSSFTSWFEALLGEMCRDGTTRETAIRRCKRFVQETSRTMHERYASKRCPLDVASLVIATSQRSTRSITPASSTTRA